MRKDWIECPLIEVCDIHDNLRKPVNSKERNERINGKTQDQLFPYYGATGQVGFIDDYLTDDDYVLIGEDAAPFLDYSKDVAYRISGKTWVNNHAHILKSKFNDMFLLHYLNNFNYRNYVSGTTRLKLTQGSLKQIPIKVAPLPEQRAIVAKIEELFSDLDKGIADLKKAQDQLKVYRQAVLKKAFEGELTKKWREKETNLPNADELLKQIKEERQKHYEQQIVDWKKAVKVWEKNGKEYSKPSKPKKLAEFTIDFEEKTLELPTNWKEGVLEYIADAIDPQPSHRTPPKVEAGIPYISIADINKDTGDINFDSSRKVGGNVLQEHINRYNLREGDFVIGKIGTIGKPFFIPTERFFTLSANVVLVRPYENTSNSKFLYHLNLSPIIEQQFKKGAKATTQAAFGIKKVRLLRVPLCSVEEQYQIVQEIESRLSVCDKVEQSITESLNKAKALRQSILKKAFKGTLLSSNEIAKCKQATDYEPASVLLVKIKAEKKKA